MIDNFTCNTPTKLIFGKGEIKNTPSLKQAYEMGLSVK